MNEFIDKAALIESVVRERESCLRIINEESIPDIKRLTEILRFVSEQEPEQDVERVIRCKDCLYYMTTLPKEAYETVIKNPHTNGTCDMWESNGFEPHDFCSFARSREGNEE